MLEDGWAQTNGNWRRKREVETWEFFFFNYLIVNQYFQSLNHKLWDEIGFRKQIYSFPTTNWNFGKHVFCWEHKGFFREGLQPTPAPVFVLGTQCELQSYRLLLGISCYWGMRRFSVLQVVVLTVCSESWKIHLLQIHFLQFVPSSLLMSEPLSLS